MLNNYEWYRRWRGGYYDFDKNSLKVSHRWDLVDMSVLTVWNTSKYISDYTAYYPSKGAKPRLRIRALSAPVSIETLLRTDFAVAMEKMPNFREVMRHRTKRSFNASRE